jgi:heptosyltransferase-3
MRLLFIKLKHIGDALIMTPMLTAVRARHPEAEIHVVVRRGTEGILAGCPAIDQLHTSAAPAGERQPGARWHDIQLLRRLRKVGFDTAFELGDGDRGRMLAWLCGAKKRFANDTHPPMSRWWRSRFTGVGTENWKGRHRVEKDFVTVQSALDLAEPIPPLCFDTDAAEVWPHAGPFILFHPATRWTQKRWPRERWIELGQALAKSTSIVVSCGPDAEEVAEAQAIADGIGTRATSTKGKLSWAQLAGALRAAKMFVGVDTAAMHLAAACQCPTVALFGSSRDWAWHPWAVRHQILGPTEADWQAARDTGQVKQEIRKLIFKVSVKETLAACQAMLAR